MYSRIKQVVLLAAGLAFSASALAHDAGHFAAGVPGDPKKPAQVMMVTMKEGDGKMMFIPRSAGHQARRTGALYPNQRRRA